MADSFRMDTSGDKAYREDELRDAMQLFDEATKSGAVMAAIEYAKRHSRALERASEHEDMTEELADVLSTSPFKLEYEVRRDFHRPGDE